MSDTGSSLAMRVLKMALAVVLVVGLCPSAAYATPDESSNPAAGAGASQATAEGIAEITDGSTTESETSSEEGNENAGNAAENGSAVSAGTGQEGQLTPEEVDKSTTEDMALPLSDETGSEDESYAVDSESDSLSLMASGTASDIVSKALSQTDGYYGSKNKYNNYNGQAWCAYFVVWCAREAGVSSDVIPSIYGCSSLVSWFKNKGLWHSYSYTPKAGDLIFYSSTNGGTAAHVGLVTKVSGGYVQTKEGNVNDNNEVDSFSNRKVGSNGFPSYSWYIIGYASPSYASTHTHSYSLTSTDKNRDGSDTQHKLTYKCSCGSTKTELKDHSWVWSGVTRKCSVCGQEYTYHENAGEYLTSQTATLFKGDKSSTGSYTDIPSGKKLKITEIKKNSANHWMGKTTYGGHTGWVYLHNTKYNGNAGQHTFKNGKCTACGCVQGSSEPGVYKVKNSSVTLYKDDMYSSTTKSAKAGEKITVTSVEVTTYNYYCGRTADGYLVSMDALELEPVSSVGGTPVEVREGNYYIKLAKNTSYQMDIYNGSKDNKAKLTIYPVNNSGAQQFKLTRNSNGSYTIVNINSGKCIDAYNNGKTNGTALIQYTVGSGKANQQWYIERNDDGTYSFRGVASNLYMHIASGKVSNSNPVHLWEGCSSENAHWVLVRMDGTSVVPTQDMYRLYNPNSGEHFYTASTEEKTNLVNAGWNYEGIGWTAPVTSSTPVYRMYNPNPSPKTGSGEHHYTTSSTERDSLIAAGWKYEGIGWYSDDAETTPLYRLYNPNEYNNNHHYTTSTGERDNLLSLGWRDEGIAWYGVDQ